jgi:dihydrofolate reductase
MRRIVMFNNVSADGYFAAPDGNLNWVIQDDEVFKTSRKNNADIDTMLFGRRTYDLFEAFWPNALDGSSTSPDPHHPGHRSEAIHDMAVWINEAKKVVFSRSRKDVTWKNSHLVHELDPKKIEAMKNEPGKDMMVFGSGSVVSQLTQHGLIDEYDFVVSPILLGGGRTMLNDVAKSVKLELLDEKKFRSGCVMLRYGRAR